MADIVLKGLDKRFGDTQALSDLNLSIRDGEFVVLLGPTGAGKTTTLRLIAGLERPIAVASRSMVATSRAKRPPSATSPSSSSNIRSIRT